MEVEAVRTGVKRRELEKAEAEAHASAKEQKIAKLIAIKGLKGHELETMDQDAAMDLDELRNERVKAMKADAFDPADLDWIKRRQQDESSKLVPDQTGETTKNAIRETKRLFLRNLPYSASESDLRDLLEPFGDLEEVWTFK